MKIHSLFALSLAAFVSILPLQAFAKSNSVLIDTTKSKIQWTGKKVTGQHNGTVALKSGKLELDGNKLKGGDFEIDMQSIVDEDIKDPAMNKKLTGHLKSDDFFGVDKHPVATFKITQIKPLTDKKLGTHEVTGDLSIKGMVHPITFPATIETNGKLTRAKGKLKIDRTKYNIRYGSGKFFENLGDKMINDEFEIDLDVATKN